MVSKTQLIDTFGRHIKYVRLSVTDQCNLRCFYCIPSEFRRTGEPEDWLTFDEIERVINIFSELGVRHVRITGGEPLLRRNLPELVQKLARLPKVTDLSLTTNATLLADQVEQLVPAGIQRINVSLDSLRPARFTGITGGDLQQTLHGLMSAKQAGINLIKINMLALKGINDDEFGYMVDFCMKHGFTLRLIETMPIGVAGLDAAAQYYLDLRGVEKQLRDRFELLPSVVPGGGPARYYQVAGTDFRIGFITPISQRFCETCNRVRLSANGTVYPCLGQNIKYALRPLLRNGASDTELKDAIIQSVRLRPKQHEFREKPAQVVRWMSVTGG